MAIKKKTGAVMVVGAGISGMQSALDLANSGFKVYLIEEKSSIGGRMSQLDKTFPTNDCSMCMISPKLIEVGKHNNIEIITNAKVQGISGEEGNFTVNVLKQPRFIDEAKCTSCGDCVTACPVELANEFDQGLSRRKAVSKRYAQAMPGAMSISRTGRAPCKLSCPAGCNGQGYVALISKKKYVESVDHIKQWIPLPSALGRICHHPCEQACNRNEVDEPVGIAKLKSFVSDYVREKRKAGAIPPEKKPVIDQSKPRIAIVGAGPSGLTCAYDLVKKGYPVTIFEASSRPGGQLQLTIPSYRLPKQVLADDIKEIIDLGIELKLNTPVANITEIKKQGFKAVYVAIGAQKSANLTVPGSGLPEVLPAMDFLRDVSDGKQIKLGKKVIITGGGNVAIDAARSAIRLGAEEVRVIYRRSEAEMPARVEEIEDAREEGVKFQFLADPKQFIGKDNHLTAVECSEMQLGEPDASGRRRPVATGKTFTISCDTAIIAIGQSVDLSLTAGSGVKSSKSGLIAADPLTLATDESGVFAGGDGVTGPKSAVEAIKHGHEAAVSIERFLTGKDLKEGRVQPEETPAPLPKGEHERVNRLNLTKIPLEKRLSGFDEVEIGYSEAEAIAESNRCLNCGPCSDCRQCEAVCQIKAVDFNQKPENLQIPVGSVVLAPGFDPFDASLKGEYGYGRMQNVITSLEFERILSASGPYRGQVKRPSDGQHPKKIAWIQCVGSRDETCGRDYCSSVCCMYATKQAIIAREHDNAIQPTIFYTDIRAFSKGFERYYESAKGAFGVNYVKSLVSGIKELQQSKKLILEHGVEGGGKVEEEFDMVVLSVGLVPSLNSKELADTLAIDLNKYGFAQTGEFTPNATNRPGIYVAGSFEAPMDIPESVMSGSSAASQAAEVVADARGTLVAEKEYPPELDTTGEEPRVGVFVCRCGTNIARVVDVPAVTEYAKTLPHVVHAEENIYTCSTDTQNKIIRAIKDKKLNRVVVAACSPRTHEPLFQNTIREACMNKYLFEMSNIRDQCSWVHSLHLPEASDKAKDLIKMAVARAVTLQPLHEAKSDMDRKALVIGGGASGMTAALALAGQGFESVLIEREKDLGGNLKHKYYTESGADPQALLKNLIKQVESEPKITIYKGAELKRFSGYVGNYKTEIATADGQTHEVGHGVVILATGGTEYKPVEYLYGKSNRVLTQLELEEKIARGAADTKDWKSVAMIQCVGSREEKHMYCSRLCCNQAIQNAIKLKDANPATDVYILYRDIRAYALHELLYREARNKGVIFIRFDADKKPEVAEANGKLTVKVYDTTLAANVLLEPDRVILSTAIRPQADADELASKLKLPLTQDKFFMEAHPKLRPLDFVNEGMYLCGMAHSPQNISESIRQARGAVSRAATMLSRPYLMVGGLVSVVNPDQCVACLTCVRACPFNVPRINADGVAEINPAACQGCGICASVCPRKAIKLQHYSDQQISAKTAALSAAGGTNA